MYPEPITHTHTHTLYPEAVLDGCLDTVRLRHVTHRRRELGTDCHRLSAGGEKGRGEGGWGSVCVCVPPYLSIYLWSASDTKPPLKGTGRVLEYSTHRAVNTHTHTRTHTRTHTQTHAQIQRKNSLLTSRCLSGPPRTPARC
jgi:hypothetical protein